MANNIEERKNLGKIGDYSVETLFESKTSFPTTRQWTGSGYEEKRIMARKLSKTVTLRSPLGDTVEFRAYVHRGQTNYRDSREKDPISEFEAVSEIRRMLGLDNDDYAKRLLSLGAVETLAAP